MLDHPLSGLFILLERRKNMYIEEDELNDLRSVRGIHQDDVAMLIDTCEDYDELVSELKKYFELDEKYYEERKFWENAVKNFMNKENV